MDELYREIPVNFIAQIPDIDVHYIGVILKIIVSYMVRNL